MTVYIFHDQSLRKNVADPAGSNPQPPDHQSDAHPTAPPRPACACDFFFYYRSREIVKKSLSAYENFVWEFQVRYNNKDYHMTSLLFSG